MLLIFGIWSENQSYSLSFGSQFQEQFQMQERKVLFWPDVFQALQFKNPEIE